MLKCQFLRAWGLLPFPNWELPYQTRASLRWAISLWPLPQQIGHSLSPEDQTTLLWTTSQNSTGHNAGMQYRWGQSVSERKEILPCTPESAGRGLVLVPQAHSSLVRAILWGALRCEHLQCLRLDSISWKLTVHAPEAWVWGGEDAQGALLEDLYKRLST